jgi:hypothetical protein
MLSDLQAKSDPVWEVSGQRDDTGCVVESPNRHFQLAESAFSFGDDAFWVARPSFELVGWQSDEEGPCVVQSPIEDCLSFQRASFCDELGFRREFASLCWLSFACVGPTGDVSGQRNSVRLSRLVPGRIQENSDQVINETFGPGCHACRDVDSHWHCSCHWLFYWKQARTWHLRLVWTLQ